MLSASEKIKFYLSSGNAWFRYNIELNGDAVVRHFVAFIALPSASLISHRVVYDVSATSFMNLGKNYTLNKR